MRRSVGLVGAWAATSYSEHMTTDLADGLPRDRAVVAGLRQRNEGVGGATSKIPRPLEKRGILIDDALRGSSAE